MVKTFLSSCFLLSVASSSESGVLSFRAKQSLAAGRYAKSYTQLEKALLATRKESDLLAEGRVLINGTNTNTKLDFFCGFSFVCSETGCFRYSFHCSLGTGQNDAFECTRKI